MGNKFEVYAWLKNSKGKFEYRLMHNSDDYEEAFKVMKRLKKEGCGCVKLEWRGEYNGE